MPDQARDTKEGVIGFISSLLLYRTVHHMMLIIVISGSAARWGASGQSRATSDKHMGVLLQLQF